MIQKEILEFAEFTADQINRLFDSSKVDYFIENECLKVRWVTGANEGGNCWGGEAQYVQSDVPTPEFLLMDGFILSLNPNFPLLEYQNITKKIKSDTKYASDYYCNGTYFEYKIIPISDILDSLEKTKSIIDEETIMSAYDFLNDTFLPLHFHEAKKIKFKK